MCVLPPSYCPGPSIWKHHTKLTEWLPILKKYAFRTPWRSNLSLDSLHLGSPTMKWVSIHSLRLITHCHMLVTLWRKEVFFVAYGSCPRLGVHIQWWLSYYKSPVVIARYHITTDTDPSGLSASYKATRIPSWDLTLMTLPNPNHFTWTSPLNVVTWWFRPSHLSRRVTLLHEFHGEPYWSHWENKGRAVPTRTLFFSSSYSNSYRNLLKGLIILTANIPVPYLSASSISLTCIYL